MWILSHHSRLVRDCRPSLWIFLRYLFIYAKQINVSAPHKFLKVPPKAKTNFPFRHSNGHFENFFFSFSRFVLNCNFDVEQFTVAKKRKVLVDLSKKQTKMNLFRFSVAVRNDNEVTVDFAIRSYLATSIAAVYMRTKCHPIAENFYYSNFLRKRRATTTTKKNERQTFFVTISTCGRHTVNKRRQW